jgi:hypothetical protein
MTKSLITPGTIFVEGSEDQKILAAWFPHLQFVAEDGKNRVKSRLNQRTDCWGILDRDFADEVEVEQSWQNSNRLTLLRRYCIENYLLEPAMIAQAAERFVTIHPELQPWTSHAYIEQRLLNWAQDLVTYAAANALISRWRSAIEGDFLQYFGPLPPLPRDGVVAQLHERLQRLPNKNELERQFEGLCSHVSQDVLQLPGLHRWINGKVLLEDVLYQQGFNQHNLSKSRFRDELIEAGKNYIPYDLVELAQKWTQNRS